MSSSQPSGFKRFALAVGFFLVICLPALYWAAEKFLHVDLQKSAAATWARFFDQFDSGAGGGDDGGD